ncbi:hypothetical protein N8H72_27650 [Pseudomonas koreensis]|uniref:hypothetical protein n=1 Tax=Pseudomonas koreensis TaxID=198620 RepID=UPI0021C59089|nr:hypothetical protein [Pseudomonas koreensis]MCU0093776.1 hypothetical protein [Pseudomonas koreensis]
MSNSTPPSQSIFLYPARITLATAPIIGAHYGVLRAIYDLMPKGCEVVADAFLGQQEGDEVRLNLNDQTNIARATTQGTNDSVKLFIPHGLLIPGIVNRMTYTVMRGSSNQGTSEPPVEIIYNKEGPGEQDVTPGDGANSSLKLLLPKEITDGVGPGFTEAIVCVEYAWCRAYDRIRLNCNGHDVFHTVTENQAPPPPAHGSATPTRICFKVTSADLKDDPEFMFSFTVNDQLKNSPDSDAPWSAVETVVVDQAGLLLWPLILRELLSDALDPSETFDLSKVGTEFWAIILTNDPRFEAGHTIVVTLVIKNPGKPDVTLTGTGTVEVDEFGQNKPCPVKFDFDPSVIVEGAHIVGTYQLLTGVTPIGKSKAAIATVIGKAIPDEKPAIIRAVDSKGNNIPDTAFTTASAVKFFGTAAKNQNVQVFANNVPKGNASVNAQGDWEHEVTQLNMARHVFHTVASYGSGQPSNSYTVNVMTLENWSNEAVGRVFLPNIPNTVSSGLIVTNLGGTNLQTQILNGTPPDKWLVVWGRCRFSFGAQNMSKVTVSILSATEITVTFLDTNGNPIGVVVDSPFVEFSAPPGSFINAFIVDLLREGDKGGYVNKIAWSDYC